VEILALSAFEIAYCRLVGPVAANRGFKSSRVVKAVASDLSRATA
jgi:hypothetical protein